MKIRDFVDAFRRKPAQESSQVPRRKTEEDDSLPPVEVAESVSQADRPLMPTSSSVVQTLMGGRIGSQRSASSRDRLDDSKVPTDTPSSTPPYVEDSKEPLDTSSFEVSLDLPQPSGLSEPNEVKPPAKTALPVPERAEDPLTPPPTFPGFDLSDFTVSEEKKPEHRPPMIKPVATGPLQPAKPGTGTLPPRRPPIEPLLPPKLPSRALPQPPEGWPSQPIPSQTPVEAAAESTGLEGLLSGSINNLKAFSTLNTGPLGNVGGASVVGFPFETLGKFVSGITRISETTSLETLSELLVQTASDCLGCSRVFAVFFDEEGTTLPISIEKLGSPSGASLLGTNLPTTFSTKLLNQKGTQENPLLIELASGLSFVPPEFFAPVEWYLLPTGLQPWKMVIGLQWHKGQPPPSQARQLAEALTSVARITVGKIQAEKNLEIQKAIQSSALEAASKHLPAPVAEQALLQLDEAIMISDRRRQVRFGNPIAEFVTGCFNGELTRNTLKEISQGPGRANAALWQHLDQLTEDQQLDASLQTPDGSVMSVIISTFNLPTFEGKGAELFSGGRLLALRDVTRSRNEAAEAAKTELDALTRELESLKENLFASNGLYETARDELEFTRQELTAANEALWAAQASSPKAPPEQVATLRSSLLMVLGFSELLHRGEYGPMNAQQFEMFRNIEHHAKHMSSILDSIFPLES